MSAVLLTSPLFAESPEIVPQLAGRKVIPATKPRPAFRIRTQHDLRGILTTCVFNGVGVRFEDPLPDAESAEDSDDRTCRSPRIWIEGGAVDDFILGQGSNAVTPAGLGLVLHDEIEAIHSVCNLTAAQRKKLVLAGAGDVKRFFDRAAGLKARLTQSDAIFTEDQFREWVTRLATDCEQLSGLVDSGFFDDDSLFLKTLNATLTTEQKLKLARARPPGTRVPAIPADGWVGAPPPDLTGKPLLLYFWTSRSASSRGILPTIQQLADEGACVMAMHAMKDASEEIAKIIHDGRITFPSLPADHPSAAAFWHIEGYQITTIPYCIIVDSNGYVAGHGRPSQELFDKFRKLK